MIEIFQLLTFYYACDMAAAERRLPLREVMACTATYEAIKDHFAEDETGFARNIAGYRAFKTWEAENPDTVAELRAQARAR